MIVHHLFGWRMTIVESDGGAMEAAASPRALI